VRWHDIVDTVCFLSAHNFGHVRVHQVAKIVADEMNNYLLYEHTLQIALVPPEKVHAKL
jgi:hypothetical protein